MSPLRSSTVKEVEAVSTDEAVAVTDASAISISDDMINGNELGLSTTQLFLNGILLVTCFGFALYTILEVDKGMTRGWSQAEIMMRIPVDTWKTYEYNLQDSPIETKTFINVIIYLLGDWLSQTVFKKRNVLQFDAWQTIRNGFIGLCFGPLVHAYYEFSDHILPVEVAINRVYKILMDQSIYLTIKCSMYIVAVGVLSGDSWEDAFQSVKDRIKGIILTAWKFWPLVHCVTYGLIPARHRILWVNCVDLVWNAILASLAREEIPEAEAAALESSGEAGDYVFISESIDAPKDVVTLLATAEEVQGASTVPAAVAFDRVQLSKDEVLLLQTSIDQAKAVVREEAEKAGSSLASVEGEEEALDAELENGMEGLLEKIATEILPRPQEAATTTTTSDAMARNNTSDAILV